MADWDYICKGPSLDPPDYGEPEEEYNPMEDVACNCDKCGCDILYNEECFVFVDIADKRVFCSGCLLKNCIERQ